MKYGADPNHYLENGNTVLGNMIKLGGNGPKTLEMVRLSLDLEGTFHLVPQKIMDNSLRMLRYGMVKIWTDYVAENPRPASGGSSIKGALAYW
jgi:hypothetical protein